MTRFDSPEPPPDLEPPPQKASLPPTQKLAREIWTDVFLLLVLGIALGGTVMGAVKPEFFEKILLGVLFIIATKISPKLVDSLPFLKR